MKKMWSKQRYDIEVKEKIKQMAEPEYKVFALKLLPNVETDLLGVRLPKLRKIAKKIAREDWVGYMKVAQYDTFEEQMLQGMVLGAVKEDLGKLKPYLKKFIAHINNWSVCDSFCSSLKIAQQEKEVIWEFLQPYFSSEQEYEIRFALVMFLNYYVEPDFLQQGFVYFNRVNKNFYYVKMAVAWAISICYIRYPKETLLYLDKKELDIDTYQKALQKIMESTRVSKEEKEMFRKKKKIQQK